MSGWSTAADLREQVEKRWRQGRLLASLIDAEPLFPMRLVLRVPSSADLSQRYADVRDWAAALQRHERRGFRLVWRELRHRVIGQNSLPDEAWVDTLDDALRLIDKQAEARAFGQVLAQTREQAPALLPWLLREPLRALSLAGDWPRLLAIVAWVERHPRPGIYLRQVDVAGIHSKFIEAQRGVLGELLDLALPPEAIDATAQGVSQFARRYGFRDKPLRLRFRWLDPRQAVWATGDEQDYSVAQAVFARLDPSVSRVFITENEINFLAFPRVADSMVIFGAGYGVDMLAPAAWLATRELHYWGDIDTHGFAILDQLRGRFPHARSLLMDRATLLDHEAHWTDEAQPTLRDLTRLDEAERTLYDDLRWKRLADRPLRLEQERIAFGRVEEAIARV